MAEPEPQYWQDGNCQNGGSNEQIDNQPDTQTDEKHSISSGEQAPPAELEEIDASLPPGEEEVEKVEWAVVEGTPSPAEQMVEKPLAALAAALASRGLPGLSLKHESQAKHLCAFAVAVQEAGWPFDAFIGEMLDRWQRLLPLLPPAPAKYEGNQQRPTFQVLAYSRHTLIRSTGYLLAADRLHGVLTHELAKANKVPVLRDAAAGLVKAASQFVAVDGMVNGSTAKLMVPKALRDVLAWPGDPKAFCFTAIEASTIATAAAHPDFVAWASEHTSEFLPAYRQREKAVKCQFAPNVVPPFALKVSPPDAGVCSRPAA